MSILAHGNVLAHEGHEHLPPLTLLTFVTRADPFSVATVVVLVAAGLYLAGVTRGGPAVRSRSSVVSP